MSWLGVRRRRVALVAAAVLLSGCSGASGAAPGGPASGSSSASSAASPSPPSSASSTPSRSATAPDAGTALPAPLAAPAPVPAGQRPRRVQIPRIGVDSSLVDLGIAADGTLQVPADYQRAGWLVASAVPGRRGPAVIAGHVDSRTGPAVFYRLRELRVGDDVVVVRADARRVHFTVTDVQQYPKKHFPTDDVYGPVPAPVLRLITCGGSFDRGSGHYRDNVVVYAS